MWFSVFRLRLNSLLASYSPPTNKTASSNHERTPTTNSNQQKRKERPAPRSIRLKPQEYFLLVIAFIAVSALVIYNLFVSYYEYYESDA